MTRVLNSVQKQPLELADKVANLRLLQECGPVHYCMPHQLCSNLHGLTADDSNLVRNKDDTFSNLVMLVQQNDSLTWREVDRGF